MKKIVITFGLISGAITATMMLVTIPLVDRVSFDKLEILGYATIVISFLMVFFGIRSYRENVGGGKISFGRAFGVGILITLVSCVLYVATWEFIFYKLTPDFVDKYGNHLIEKEKRSGASPEALEAKRVEVERFKELYKNPLINIAFTMMEPLPIGLLTTLISAVILRRKEPKTRTVEANA
jgi:Protein of unknown function (DUF4199)